MNFVYSIIVNYHFPPDLLDVYILYLKLAEGQRGANARLPPLAAPLYAAFNKMNELWQQGDIVRAPLGQGQIIKCTKLRLIGEIKHDPESRLNHIVGAFEQITALRQKFSRFLKVKYVSYVQSTRMFQLGWILDRRKLTCQSKYA